MSIFSGAKVGDTYRCVSSKSHAYSTGKAYKVSKNIKGQLVLTGNDGLTDPLNMLVSAFQKADKGEKRLEVIDNETGIS